MYVVLQILCWGLFIGAPAILLAARFYWPRRVQWWLVVVVTAILSTLLSTSSDYLGPRAHFEWQDACVEASLQRPSEQECAFWTYDVWVLPMHLKWIPGFLCLVAWLPLYGLSDWLRTRHDRPN